MRRMRNTLLGALLLLAVPAGAAVITANIAGEWTLTVVDPSDGCTYVGPLTLAQTGTMFSGSANLSLASGTNPPCLPSFSGMVSGDLAGFVIQFGVATGGGTGSFDGMVEADENAMSGTWTFAANTGTWQAVRVSAVLAPALNAAGLVVLLVSLLGAGVLVLRRHAR